MLSGLFLCLTKGKAMLKKIYSSYIENNPSFFLSEDELAVVRSIYEELSHCTDIDEMNQYIQHGNTSTLLHSVAVAHFSYLFAKVFRIRINARSLIIGALLHDYYLYDWHVYDKSHTLHGFRHPFTSLRNAKKHLKLNLIEENIIVRHMFPLIPIPPTYRESIIVCTVDKLCSLYETFSRSPYKDFSCETMLLNRRRKLQTNL